MARGAPAQAIPYFEHVRPANLERVSTLFALISKQTDQQALRMGAELSQQDKNDVKVHFSLGVLLASEGQYKTAQLELEKADALNPGTFGNSLQPGRDLASQR